MVIRKPPEPLTEAEAIWLARWVVVRAYRAAHEAREWERLGTQKYEDFRVSAGGIADDWTLRELLQIVVARCTTVGEGRRGRHVVARYDVALVVARRDLAGALKRETKGTLPSSEALRSRWAAIEGAGLEVPEDRQEWLRSHVRSVAKGAHGPDIQAVTLLTRLFGPARRKQDAAKATVRARVGRELADSGTVQQILDVLDAQGGPDPAPVAALVDFALRDLLAEPKIAADVADLESLAERRESTYQPVSPVPPREPPEYDPEEDR